MLAFPRHRISSMHQRRTEEFQSYSGCLLLHDNVTSTEGKMVKRVSILLRMLASPRQIVILLVRHPFICFNPTQDACFPTTEFWFWADVRPIVSILLRML